MYPHGKHQQIFLELYLGSLSGRPYYAKDTELSLLGPRQYSGGLATSMSASLAELFPYFQTKS